MPQLNVCFTRVDGNGLLGVEVVEDVESSAGGVPLAIECDDGKEGELRTALNAIPPAPDHEALQKRLRTVLKQFGISY